MKFSKRLSATVLLLFGASLVPALAQDNPAQAAARAALEKMFQSPTSVSTNLAAPGQSPMLTNSQPATNQTPVVAAATAAKSNSKSTGLKPITSPPLPISAAKQAQLEVLLELYKADRMTPADYQKQRAAVLAAPN
jgi:hypothetical protein